MLIGTKGAVRCNEPTQMYMNLPRLKSFRFGKIKIRIVELIISYPDEFKLSALVTSKCEFLQH